jgi:peroxiredoxin
VQLHRHREELDEAGVRLGVIGQGSPRHAEHFIDEHGLDGMQVLVDPDRKTYEAAGAKIATVDELLHPRIAARAARITATERMVQGRTQGHAAQLGGVLVVTRDGRVVWARMADDASDSAPVEEVLKAARAASDTA